MKRFISAAALLLLFVVAIPAATLLLPAQQSSNAPEYPADETQQLAVLDEFSGDILTMSMRTFLIGALACELPADFEPEALKAQSVACHTYALYMKLNKSGSALSGADFAVNTGQMRGYITTEQQRALFGSSYANVRKTLEDAVDSVYEYILTDNGQAVAAAWHAISCGATESSADVFLSPLPYLVSVDSSFDTQSPSFVSEVTYSFQEMFDLVRTFDSELVSDGAPEQWLRVLSETDNGTVTSIQFCNRVYTGLDFSKALLLRSANFTWDTTEQQITFTVRGFGHGVGMSQYGANCLARQGESFDQILLHYYPNTTLSLFAG